MDTKPGCSKKKKNICQDLHKCEWVMRKGCRVKVVKASPVKASPVKASPVKASPRSKDPSPSPFLPAEEHVGKVMLGWDGRMYESVASKTGAFRWKSVSRAPPNTNPYQKPNKKLSSPALHSWMLIQYWKGKNPKKNGKTIRPSPSVHAKEHKDELMWGNDGRMYESNMNSKTKVWSWRFYTGTVSSSWLELNPKLKLEYEKWYNAYGKPEK
jgi:hypothetical protein